MAKATFNKNIETPPNGLKTLYDLEKVITKEEFGDYSFFIYTLSEQYLGVSLEGNILSISDNAYGEISIKITVSISESEVGLAEAEAVTKLYGFYATRLEFFNNPVLEKAIGIIRTNWPSFVVESDDDDTTLI